VAGSGSRVGNLLLVLVERPDLKRIFCLIRSKSIASGNASITSVFFQEFGKLEEKKKMQNKHLSFRYPVMIYPVYRWGIFPRPHSRYKSDDALKLTVEQLAGVLVQVPDLRDWRKTKSCLD
jgi:hypothetical protein